MESCQGTFTYTGVKRYNIEQLFPTSAQPSWHQSLLAAGPQRHTGGHLHERYTRSRGAR